MSESHEADADKMPADEELQEPSTEKETGDEPKDGDDTPDDVDHQAVGIGVIEEHEPVEDPAPAAPTDDGVRSDGSTT